MTTLTSKVVAVKMSKAEVQKDARTKSFPVPAHTKIFNKRRKPGPVKAGTLVDYERDLADAALILQLMDKGALKASYKEETQAQTLTKVNSTARLTETEEVELTRRVQICGDIDARNRLVMANIGLVHLVANQMCRPPLRYEDLLQEGIIGLMRATQSYEPFRNVRFSTYSVYWIRAKIQRHIQRLEREDIPAITGAAANIDENGKKFKPRSRQLSLDRKVGEDDSRTLGDSIAAKVDNPEVSAIKKQRANILREALEEACEELGDPRLKSLVKLRLLTENPATLDQVGKKINYSREGVRILEARLLKRVKEKLKGRKTLLS